MNHDQECYTDEIDVDTYVVTRTPRHPGFKNGLWQSLSAETYVSQSLSSAGEAEAAAAGEWREIQIDKDSIPQTAAHSNEKTSFAAQEDKGEEETIEPITRKQRMCARLWLLTLALTYVIMTVFFCQKMNMAKQASIIRHASRVNPDAKEEGKTQSQVDIQDVNATAAQEVEIGFYLDRITEFSIMESGWTADFYLWFRWTDHRSAEEEEDEVDFNGTVDRSVSNATSQQRRSRRQLTLIKPKPSAGRPGGGDVSAASGVSADEIEFGILDPGETFQVIDGELLNKEELERQVNPVTTIVGDDGDDANQLYQGDNNNTIQQYLHYSLYRVQARFTHFFEVLRFPRDNYMMTLRLEDSVRDYRRLLYVADTEGSKISSRVKINGYALGDLATVSDLHAYQVSLLLDLL